jgi:hypothetical protein
MGTRSSKISVHSDPSHLDLMDNEWDEDDYLHIDTKHKDQHIILAELVMSYKNNWGNFSMLYHITKNIAKLDNNTNLAILNEIVPCFWRDNILKDVLVYNHSGSIEKDMKFAKKYPNVYVPYTLKRLKKQIKQSMYMYKYCFVENSKLTDYSISLKKYLVFVVTQLIVLIHTFKKYLYDNKLITENEYKGVFINLPLRYIDCKIDIERLIKCAELGTYDSNKVYILYI